MLSSATDLLVINTNDSGPGSLRAAFQAANSSSEAANISFNIPGAGPHIIRPGTGLPELTNTVVIDGYTQPGATPNTLSQGDNARILIEITTNLYLRGLSSVIQGLSVQGLYLTGNGATVQGNFIGVDPSGTNSLANGSGIYLNSSFEHQIGGPNPAARNIISGNNIGISGFGAPNPLAPPEGTTVIQGNYIGTDKTGTAPLPNINFGISISEMLQLIGGTNVGEGNIIAFNRGPGVNLTSRSKSVQVWGNSIFSNGGPGIDGGSEGPLITSAVPGTALVQGTFAGVPGQSYRIELFANKSCDPSGYGEGTVFIGSARATVSPDGSAAFSATVTPALAAGDVITGTISSDVPDATTSGFSRCAFVGPTVDLGLTILAPQTIVPVLSNTTVSVRITNKSSVTASGILVKAEIPEIMDYISGTAGWTNQTDYATFYLASLGPGTAVTNTITLQPQLVGTAITRYSLVADQPDSIQTNNLVTVTAAVFNPFPRELVVTNTKSSGPGSLDQAISDANDGRGGDLISFDIPGPGVKTIESTFLYSRVPVTIDGYTQPGASPNTLSIGDNAVLLIDLGKATLELAGGSTTVRGLVVPSIYISGTPGGLGGGTVIEGCFVGTDPSGRLANTNATGIEISGADDTVIGGRISATRNLVSGNRGNKVAAIQTDAARTVIQGNYIGTDVTGTTPLGNAGAGIFFSGQPNSGGQVGGTKSGVGNIIAFNDGPGVVVAEPGFGPSIQGNSIYGNRGIGIALGTDRASLNSSPSTNGLPIITNVISSGNQTRIQGYLLAKSVSTYRLEFFSSPRNTNAFYQSEGKAFLGFTSVTTDANGRAGFDASFGTPSLIVSATATDPVGNTSSFTQTTQPNARCFQPGDLLIGFFSDGHIQWRDARAAPIAMLIDRGTDTFADIISLSDRTTWAADLSAGMLERFGSCVEPISPITVGVKPSAFTVDAAGNVYVGFAGATNNVWKYDSAGRLLAQFSVPVSSAGVDALDLAADQQTLFYESHGNAIRRYDLVAAQPLTDFVSNLSYASGVRILSDGGVLTTDFRRVVRYTADGNIVWSNSVPGISLWFTVRLDPDGVTCWAVGSGAQIAQFDLATGALVQTFAADISGNAATLAVVGEPTAGRKAGSVRPVLNIALQGAQVIISWNGSASDFFLQNTHLLGPLATWQKVPEAPALVNGQYFLTNSASGKAQFYRLQKP